MAGRIPQDFIEQLLARIDIVGVVGERVPLKKAGREYTACCPFHNEKTPSFTVSPSKQFYHCFGCGAHGSAISFLMEYEHLEYVEAIESLANSLGLAVPREGGGQPSRRRQNTDLYSLMEVAGRWFSEQLPSNEPASQYLQRRGLSQEVIQNFGLGYAPAGWENIASRFSNFGNTKLLASGLLTKNEQGRVYDRFRERIMFPIRDRRGRVIGFGGRVLGKGEPKYLNSPETEIFHKGNELYGLFEARNQTRKLERLLVVEGYMDVIALAQYDVTYAVATLGTATTREHIKQLLRLVPEVIFCFDGDRAGREAAWRALENALPELRDDKEIRFLFLPQGEDPDSQIRQVGKQVFEAGLKNALPLSDYLISALQQRYNLSSGEGKSRFLNEGLRLLENVPPILLREQFLGEFSTLTSTPIEILRQKLKERLVGGGKTLESSITHLSDQDVRRTPMRHAIAMLLHNPKLVIQADSPEQILRYSVPGMELMALMVESIEENPHIHTASLLERFRQTEYEAILQRLSGWQPEYADQDVMQREFAECLQQIRRQAQKNQLETLLHRERTIGLSQQERNDLLSLLSELHGIDT